MQKKFASSLRPPTRAAPNLHCRRTPDVGARDSLPASVCRGRASACVPPTLLTSRLQPPQGSGSWGGLRAGSEPGSRAGTRARPAGSPAMREGWGIPGDPGREGVPGRGPGVGSDGRAFSLFRCLKLAPAERCGHVTERRQSARPLSPRSRPSAAAAGRSGGRGAAGRRRQGPRRPRRAGTAGDAGDGGACGGLAAGFLARSGALP
ncbi:Microtubule-Actin Cross-Linking Factor 1, Isoforms 1/2/3/5 [Manis pentadactyla]|nr:Microtubule-Actin Cross-Linking Factor 1, Isoforms 1/2/3/5 [Manis pentadactyla]